MAKGNRTTRKGKESKISPKKTGGRIIRKAELPARKPNERNPFLTGDGKLKPGIIPPKPPPKPPEKPSKKE